MNDKTIAAEVCVRADLCPEIETIFMRERLTWIEGTLVLLHLAVDVMNRLPGSKEEKQAELRSIFEQFLMGAEISKSEH